MAKVVQGIVRSEMDTSKLFEKFTIDEIREIEHKTRSDIERKKEDLRTMVGERYRDLIEAADTISEMKNTVSKVTQSVNSMQGYCQKLQHTHLIKGVSVGQQSSRDIEKKNEEREFFGIATQIKLLLDMPEKIWSAMDDDQYLCATQLFLLARHINTSLQLDSQQSVRINTWFPVLSRQWAAISQFKTTILQGCRQLLKACDTKESTITSCLCSIILLEDSTPRQVFTEFLLARTGAVQQLFQPDEKSIKSQICEIVQLIITTIYQIHSIFYCHSGSHKQDDKLPTNLLMETLNEVMDKNHSNSVIIDTSKSVSLRLLPQSVSNFRPSLRTPPSAISDHHLQSSCTEWLNTSVQDVHAGVTKLLVYVTNIKALAGIRDALWEFMQKTEYLQEWAKICERVVKRKVAVWEEFVQPLCLSRVQSIIDTQLDQTLNTHMQNITKVLTDLSSPNEKSLMHDRDLSSYIWHESPKDIAATNAWLPASSKTLADGGGLMMKARAFTPTIQRLCQHLDGKLKVLLEDLDYYTAKDSSSEDDSEDGPFNRLADSPVLQKHIQTGCLQHMNKLRDHIGQQLKGSQGQLNSTDIEGAGILINRILLLGRLCGAMCDLAPNLHKCVLLKEKQDKAVKIKRQSSISAKSKQIEDPIWIEVKSNMTDTSCTAFKIWTDYTCSQLVSHFEQMLLDNSGHTALRASTQWDEVQIQEETEDGKTIKSVIRVPMQCSWFVQTLLYDLCGEINRVAGHSISRAVLLELVDNITESILKVFESYLTHTANPQTPQQIPQTQTKALQLIFDIKFLSGILSKKDDSSASKLNQKRVAKIVDKLESKVDPFDLDVFSPYMQSHLYKHIQRCSVLFGSLTSLDKHGTFMSTRGTTSGSQEQHNVLPLSTCTTRFNLLPFSAQSTRSSLQQPLLSPTKMQMLSPTTTMTTLSQESLPAVQRDSGSFFNQVSTIWFSNIGNKKT
ncbi:unnamed protein product [Owenia fusiformis]|uniref:Conserved oligomeric Golgi complex subunit 1 n=1 Tax=Owenia fusiformis TaxID=6347 RepID=A0A8J1TYT1_OWEFU|nr:unnamed protein product [Owenia fusiformis]